jgi:hypothetical protein
VRGRGSSQLTEGAISGLLGCSAVKATASPNELESEIPFLSPLEERPGEGVGVQRRLA